MKKTLITLSLLASTFAYAQTTMCYKENIQSPSQAETAMLNGGKCMGKASLNDMKAQGWIVDDIKITPTKTGMNYTYILKKGSTVTTGGQAVTTENLDELMAAIEAKIEAKNVKKAQEKKEKELQVLKDAGKNYYIQHCAQCHGEKADLKAHNVSLPLNSMTFKQMQNSIKGYMHNDIKQDKGRAIVMKPYASMLTSDKLRNVYEYIQTLK